MTATVACVLKSGGIYTPEWVTKLQAGAMEHLSRRYRFVCLSDMDVPCERIALTENWPHWWSKLELFKLTEGPVLYLDLDCVVTGPLDDLITSGPLRMCSDFILPGRHNSSVMSWSGDYSFLYDKMCENPDKVMKEYGQFRAGRIGDQAFIEDQITPTVFPEGRIVSYRLEAKEEVPERASVVSFHGLPKQDTAGGWVEW